jgi:fibronectin type 3 domain-containing protein
VAVAYLGTTDAPSATGPTPFDAGFVGHWYLYVSYSYDGGQTWTTINATPAQPVQVGSICDQGFNCSSTDQRNLLDFIDATVTKDGRVLVAFADGCGAINPNSTTCSATSTDISKSVSSWATIAYQTTGRGLFAADDKSAPSAPTLTATGGSSAINLSWTTPDPGTDPITSYQVLRGTDPSSLAPLATVPVGTNSYSDGTAQFGTTYYYAVTASSDIGTGAPSNVVSASLAAQPPAATTLSAADNNNSVLLSWTTPASPGSPITGYQIYRGTAPGTETAYMTAGPTATSFVDSQVSAQTPYYYRIAAVNGAGTGALSNETSATPTTVPSAATLTALAGKGQASLSWTSPNSGGATISGWRILRGTTSGTETLIQTITTGTTYVDNTVVAGTTYFYEVVAVNKNGAGAASNEASVTVKKGK